MSKKRKNLEKALLRQSNIGTEGMTSYGAVKNYFDEWAGEKITYDDYTSLQGYTAPRILSRRLVPLIKEQSLTNIIDFGCGTGQSGEPFIKRGYVVDGIDLSTKMMEKAEKRGYRKVEECNFVIEGFPFIEKYDVAISAGVIGDFAPLDAAILPITQALEKNALVGISVHAEFADEKQVESSFRNAGLTIIDSFHDTGYWTVCTTRSGRLKMGSKIGYQYLIAKK